MTPPLVIINAVGLTARLLPFAPRLAELAQRGWSTSFREALPAVTCTAQATLLTGQSPAIHGIVGNGWFFRDTREVRFWQQSNRLLQSEPLYATAKRRAINLGRSVKIAKLFWWFNQGADVDISVTPKPHYALDGRKHFDVLTTPRSLHDQLEKQIGTFPFAAFWGPMAGIESSRWIAAASAMVLLDERPNLTLVYLPHLDYDPQRFGPDGCDMQKVVGELDDACEPLLDAARATGARVWVVSEYGHCNVTTPVYPNRLFRKSDWLAVRTGPFGEQLDLFASRAFAVCDHQVAHVYVRDAIDVMRVADACRELPGVMKVVIEGQRAKVGLDHPRSGEIVLFAKPNAWFAYPFWLDDARAPDYARNVAIHHKPGFDPCELFFDPRVWFPRLTIAWKLAQKALGFRMNMNIIPLDATLVGGSHGLPAEANEDRPIWIGDGQAPHESPAPMTAFRNAVLNAMELVDNSASPVS